MNKNKDEQVAPAKDKLVSDSAYIQDERAATAATELPKAVTAKKPVMKYAVLAIADRLEKQYLQGVGDVAVAEAVKSLRKLADD